VQPVVPLHFRQNRHSADNFNPYTGHLCSKLALSECQQGVTTADLRYSPN